MSAAPPALAGKLTFAPAHTVWLGEPAAKVGGFTKSVALFVTVPQKLEMTTEYRPEFTSVTLVKINEGLVWPSNGTPLCNHSKVKMAQPVAVTSNRTVCPAQATALLGVGPSTRFGPRQRMAEI